MTEGSEGAELRSRRGSALNDSAASQPTPALIPLPALRRRRGASPAARTKSELFTSRPGSLPRVPVAEKQLRLLGRQGRSSPPADPPPFTVSPPGTLPLLRTRRAPVVPMCLRGCPRQASGQASPPQRGVPSTPAMSHRRFHGRTWAVDQLGCPRLPPSERAPRDGEEPVARGEEPVARGPQHTLQRLVDKGMRPLEVA